MGRVSGVVSSMTSRMRACLNRENAPYAALVLIALIIRLWDLGGRTVHYDECVHINCARGFFTNPPGWCVLGWTHGPFQKELTDFFFLFGTNEVTARLLPVVLGTAIVALPYFLRRQLGHWGSLVVTALLAFSPFLMFYSRYARNDIYTAFFMLLLVVCLWRYIEDRKARFLYIGAAALSLGFCDKTTSFIVVAIIAIFLLVLTAKELASAIAKRFDLSQLSAPGEFFILIISLVLPVFAPFINILPGVDLGKNLVHTQDGATIYNNWAIFLLIFLFVVGAAIGLRWNWRRWLTSALIFWGIYILMYTIFFTRPSYLAGGLWESIAYWVTQHEVERGGQPEFYYVMVVPIYEFLPVLFASIGVAYYAIKEKSLSAILIGGAVLSMILFSVSSHWSPQNRETLRVVSYVAASGLIVYSFVYLLVKKGDLNSRLRRFVPYISRGKKTQPKLQRSGKGKIRSKSQQIGVEILNKEELFPRLLLFAAGFLILLYAFQIGKDLPPEKLTPTLLLLLAAASIILYVHFGKANIFTKFLIYLAAFTLILFSYFGEKMPWLSVPIATTTIVFGGMFIGRVLEAFNWRRWAMSRPSMDISRILALLGFSFIALGITIAVKAPDNPQAIIPLFIIGFIIIGIGVGGIFKVRYLKPWMAQASMALVLLVLFTSTACVALYESYHTADKPPKIMIYCGISDDVKRIAYKIYEYAEETKQGNALHVVIYGGGLYDIGFRWYLRDWNPQSIHYSLDYEQGPPPGAVLLVNDKEKPVGNESWLGNYSEGEEFQTYTWYPEADTYKKVFNQSWYWDYLLKRESFKPYWTSKAWVYFPETSP